MTRIWILFFVLVLTGFGCSDSHGSADGGDSSTSDSATRDGGDDSAISDTGADAADAADAGPTLTSCATPTDCRLSFNAGCCTTCERPVASDYDAINQMFSDEHRRMSCPEWPVGCAPCAMEPPPNPGLVAGCNQTSSTCERVDLEETSWTTCADDTDCSIAIPRCCDCSVLAADDIVAIRTDRQRDLTALICDPEIACPPCVPTLPDGASAACVSGACVVLVTGTTDPDPGM